MNEMMAGEATVTYPSTATHYYVGTAQVGNRSFQHLLRRLLTASFDYKNNFSIQTTRSGLGGNITTYRIAARD